MTIICYRDGVMAADGATFTHDRIAGMVRKIARAPDGSLGAAAGDAGECGRFRTWVENGMKEPFKLTEGADFGGIVVSPSGIVTRLDNKARPVLLDADYAIEGAPEDIAAGAMEAGATAEQAVRICIKVHGFCAGPVQVERLAYYTGR